MVLVHQGEVHLILVIGELFLCGSLEQEVLVHLGGDVELGVFEAAVTRAEDMGTNHAGREDALAGVENELSGKKVGLFGSYDWGTGDWMDAWRERTEGDGAEVVDTVIANLEPDDEALESCRALGAALA